MKLVLLFLLLTVPYVDCFFDGVVTSIKNFVGNAFTTAVNAVSAGITYIEEAKARVYTIVEKTIVDGYTALVEGEFGSYIWDTVKNGLAAVYAGIVKFVTEQLEFLVQIWQAICAFLPDVWGLLFGYEDAMIEYVFHGDVKCHGKPTEAMIMIHKINNKNYKGAYVASAIAHPNISKSQFVVIAKAKTRYRQFYVQIYHTCLTDPRVACATTLSYEPSYRKDEDFPRTSHVELDHDVQADDPYWESNKGGKGNAGADCKTANDLQQKYFGDLMFIDWISKVPSSN